MARKLLSVCLSLLILCKSLPLQAAFQTHTISDAERSLAIEEAFFDGSEIPVAPKTAPFHLADSFYDYKGHNAASDRYRQQRDWQIESEQKCRAAGKVCHFPPNPAPQGPAFVHEIPNSVAPAKDNPKPYTPGPQPDYSDTLGNGKMAPALVDAIGDFLSGPKPDPEEEARKAKADALQVAYDSGKCDLKLISQDECNERLAAAQADKQAKERERLRRERAWNNLSGAGKFGYRATIPAFLAGAGLLMALAGGLALPLAAVLAGSLAIIGFPLTTLINPDPEKSFYETAGVTLATPFALSWSAISGILKAASFGTIDLPGFGNKDSKRGSGTLYSLHKAGQTAAHAVTLAGARPWV